MRGKREDREKISATKNEIHQSCVGAGLEAYKRAFACQDVYVYKPNYDLPMQQTEVNQ